MTNSEKNVLILGFFDGIHLGHRKVIKSAVDYAEKINAKTLLLTFSTAPEEYFHKKFEYIYSREYNYKLISDLRVNEIVESPFEKIARLDPEEYIKSIVERYKPTAIFTGFNYTFGKNKGGNCDTLEFFKNKYNYEYFKIPEFKINNTTVSSTKIKEFLKSGDIVNANEFLGEIYTIGSIVIKGDKIGRTIGFPTANIKYPENILKIPYGVYKAKARGLNAMLYWGIKPTLGKKDEIIEVHIFYYNGNLYDKFLETKILKKIRDEKKFSSIEELTEQLKKDKEECLK